MSNTTRISDTIAQLVDPWGERVEHTVRVVTHRDTCHTRARVWAPGYTRHLTCTCTVSYDARVRTATQAPLLDQLAAHTAPRVTGEKTRATGKAGSRPPMSLEARALITKLTAIVAEADAVMRARAGRPPERKPLPFRARLRGLVGLARAIEHAYPATVAGVHRLLRTVVREARVLLDYDPRPRMLAHVHCSVCGGRLALDPDMMNAWCVGLGTVEGPALEGDAGPVRYGSCRSTYPRHLWLREFHQEAS